MLKILATALLVDTLIHVFVTLYVLNHFKGYDPKKLSISRLGTKLSPKYKLFNASSFVLATLVTLLGLQLGFISVYAEVIVTIAGALLVLTSLLRYDKFPKIHDLVALVLMVILLLLSISFIKYISFAGWLSGFMIVIIAGIIICTGMFIFELFHRTKKLGYSKYTWYWEWGVFTLEMLFIVITCFSIVKR